MNNLKTGIDLDTLVALFLDYDMSIVNICLKFAGLS